MNSIVEFLTFFIKVMGQYLAVMRQSWLTSMELYLVALSFIVAVLALIRR